MKLNFHIKTPKIKATYPHLEYKYFLVFVCFALAACSGTKHLATGEKLYTGATIKLETKAKVKKGTIVSLAESAVRPIPNKSYFGMRPELIIFQKATRISTSKLQQWLLKKGEAPVLLSAVKPSVTASVIDAQLFNIGIFNSHTEYEIVEKKHTAQIIYTSYFDKPFVINALIYDICHTDTAKNDIQNLNDLILSDKNNSLIVKGDNYSLETLKNERIRIDEMLKNKGYFYFSPDYLYFKADTSALTQTVSLKLTLKQDIPTFATKVFKIKELIINQNYSLNDSESIAPEDTLHYKQTVFLCQDSDLYIRPKAILRSVYLQKGEVYSRENHNITLNRLMSLGTYKFVQLKFTDSDTTAQGYLDATILLTPLDKYSLRAEMDLVTKSNNYSGPRMNLSLLNRNTFAGAELMSLTMAGSFEAQLNGLSDNLFSYGFNPQIDITLPRLLVPFNIRQSKSLYTPKTHFALSYNYLKRVDYFDMRSFQFQYGFKWKNNAQNEHELNPVSVSYSALSNKSEAFIALLDANPYLQKSYDEQFIAGGAYAYTYNQQPGSKPTQFYFHATAETAGNAFSIINSLAGNSLSATNPAKLFGSVYSQFASLSLDGRMYYNFDAQNKLAFRLFSGLAHAYGNSSTLPYSKQFFSGGPNSIRAFQINSLGPGNYDQSSNNTGILQLGGDIKLEMNAEYRFDIYSFFKAALFVDAGNVWLEKSNPSNTGNPFALNTFMSEMAVGTGFGLRMDVSFFVLRFDLAMPLRKPWLDENERWVTNQIDFLSSDWRKNNLQLNIAIGYPF